MNTLLATGQADLLFCQFNDLSIVDSTVHEFNLTLKPTTMAKPTQAQGELTIVQPQTEEQLLSRPTIGHRIKTALVTAGAGTCGIVHFVADSIAEGAIALESVIDREQTPESVRESRIKATKDKQMACALKAADAIVKLNHAKDATKAAIDAKAKALNDYKEHLRSKLRGEHKEANTNLNTVSK